MLGVVRLGAALALPAALSAAAAGRRVWTPLGLAVVAAVTDYVDGPLARRGLPTRHGALLDNLADIAVVLAGTATGAALGLVSWLAPAAIALAFGTYLLASGARAGTWRPARTHLGHAAGVLNYVLVLVVAGAVTPLAAPWPLILGATSGAVVLVNLAAVLTRLRR